MDVSEDDSQFPSHSIFSYHTDTETNNDVNIFTESEPIMLNDIFKQYHKENVKSSDYMAYELINNDIVNSLEGPGPEKTFRCPKCEKCFTRKTNLQRHLATHGDDKGFICPVCSKSFNQKANLQRHMRVHASEHGNELPSFACSECDFKCAQKSNLMRHIQVHSGLRKFNCQECGRKFSQKVNLFKHMLLHTGERPFKCTLCDSGFFCKNDLIRHERKAHTGERPFPCTKCKKAFFIKSDLNKHFKSYHSKATINCMLCPFVAKTGDGLEMHIMSKHTDEKPFKCNQCDFATGRRRSLRNHSKLHNVVEGEKVRPVRICPLTECRYRTITKKDYFQHLRAHGISKDNTKKIKNVTIKEEPKTITIVQPNTKKIEKPKSIRLHEENTQGVKSCAIKIDHGSELIECNQ